MCRVEPVEGCSPTEEKFIENMVEFSAEHFEESCYKEKY